jgi:hypothetical protein
MTDPRSPFNWKAQSSPSIFARDAAFTPRKSGKSISQAQSQAVDERRSRGENVGTLHGIGKSTMKNAEERAKSLVAFKHYSTYSKARPSKESA